MSRIFVLSLVLLILIVQCNEPIKTQFYVVAHKFNNPISTSLFTSGVNQAVDSLRIESAILSLNENYEKKHLDSLFKNTSGICYASPLQNEVIAAHIKKAIKKQIPSIQFDQQQENAGARRFINSDSYSAGHAAARHIIEQFGDNGRFGILTPTLDNSESTEAIRGFRDALSKTKWKQVNIITCGNGFDQAIKQYRYATRFGNRIIWFVANDCADFLYELKNIKKDNFFIAIDLHPTENNIKFLQENLLDAVVTRDFTTMGQMCVTELASTKEEPTETDNIVINCGSIVLTMAALENMPK